MDGSLVPRWGEGVNGNVTRRTHAGRPYRSRPRDCRTVRVRHRGFCRFRGAAWGSFVEPRQDTGKATGVASRSAGQDASSSTNRPPFAMPQTPGRRGEPFGLLRIVFRTGSVRRKRADEDRGAVSQETCHPSGYSARGEMLPNASTEVVVAHRFLIERAYCARFCFCLRTQS